MMTQTKSQIRKTTLTQRKNLDQTKVAQFSKRILDRLTNLPEFKEARTLLLYDPMDNEPDTTPLFNLQKNIHFPTQSPTDPQPNYDLIVTPGIAFDTNGNRIGYGKGYFDRLFPNLSTDCIKIALAYDFQIVENIPAERHDQKVDLILTEKRKIIPPHKL
ncbi:5-formyltetrahydrofolate cyclo-ligase [Candidatus Peregrinibacteria bacterium]|nr:5-formyltetrahydrofolate cyclo-ligase [Candidatus Peregrinibacteria bacterium]MBT4056394.1 5-formyltetrahydrofolate cyclo-ligase [Candidatus Peregrinibacteria bacterium]